MSTDEEIKTILNNRFREAGVIFTEKQKDILVDAYHKVEQKTKCMICGGESNFKVTNISKNETFYFCDLHFFKFCYDFLNAYKKFGIAIKEIDKEIGLI